MANKPMLIVGGISIVLALASLGIAWSSGSDGLDDVAEVDPDDYIQGPSTTFSYTFADDDGAGSGGWYLMMDGNYDDDDGDGKTDACQNVSFTVIDSQGNDVTESASEFSCRAPSDDEEEFSDRQFDPLPDDGRILFAYVCATLDTTTEYDCSIGENYTISSNTSLYIMDNDEYGLAFLGGSLKILGSGLLATIGACCCGLGGIFLLVGIVTGGNSTPVIGYIPQQNMAPGMQMQTQTPVQPRGEMPQQQQQYTVGADIDSSSVADTPVSVWDN
tara:strand:+ start:304 stop:1125 length:822 start_codon:yes stop_codon:yes gene_type:complete